MFNQLTKRICAALLLALPCPLAHAQLAAEASTAKGGSLGVRTNDGRKHFTLTADAFWHLNVKERFDASALAFYKGKLLTINDRDGVVYEVTPGSNSVAEVKRTDLFSRRELAKLSPKRSPRYDCEGLAVDASGNLYLSEESQRIAYKLSSQGKLEALAFDWTPVRQYFAADRNASFEGIAVAGDTMYLANERSAARIVIVDLKTRAVRGSFFVDSHGFAFGGPHYTDLAFADGRLFILNRNHRCIFEIEPETKRVLAEHSFAQMELDKAVAYFTDYPTGTMEGLAVDREYFWTITDNNGKGRIADAADTRPTLFRCTRPKSNRAD